jgi:hypothetical protein
VCVRTVVVVLVVVVMVTGVVDIDMMHAFQPTQRKHASFLKKK